MWLSGVGECDMHVVVRCRGVGQVVFVRCNGV
jgi:hypothetical protein